MRDREGRERGGGHHLSRSLAYDEAPEQCGPKATQQRRVAVLVCLERVPYHLRHLHARVEWTPLRDLQLGPLLLLLRWRLWYEECNWGVSMKCDCG